MAEKYEYHKQNDYPGERVAEKKRVTDRREAADKRSDARVAEKGRTGELKADRRVAEKGRTEELKADSRVARRGRMDDDLMDSEIERSTARAQKVKVIRNNRDAIGIIIAAGVLLILLIGLGGSYALLQQQSNKIDSLNQQLSDAGLGTGPNNVYTQLSDANKQIALNKAFLVDIANVKQEVYDLNQYNSSYSNMYQLCANFMEKTNNVNHAMTRFAEKEVIYYNQIAVLDNKPQCVAKINALNTALINSQNANEEYYIQNMNECDRVKDNTFNTAESASLKLAWGNAWYDANANALTFTAAEKEVIACFA